MGQSLMKNYLHIVFCTKHRAKLIHPPIEEELHAYIGGICKQLGCPVLIVGGFTDHIHILCLLSKKIPLMTLVQKIKANSSRWMKTKAPYLSEFRWQDGYAAFSVNPKGLERVTDYIRNQHAHHSKKTFKDEYIKILSEHQAEFNEKYLWD
jgi:putative transposase